MNTNRRSMYEDVLPYGPDAGKKMVEDVKMAGGKIKDVASSTYDQIVNWLAEKMTERELARRGV